MSLIKFIMIANIQYNKQKNEIVESAVIFSSSEKT